jgi:hypothetical protein
MKAIVTAAQVVKEVAVHADTGAFDAVARGGGPERLIVEALDPVPYSIRAPGFLLYLSHILHKWRFSCASSISRKHVTL